VYPGGITPQTPLFCEKQYDHNWKIYPEIPGLKFDLNNLLLFWILWTENDYYCQLNHLNPPPPHWRQVRTTRRQKDGSTPKFLKTWKLCQNTKHRNFSKTANLDYLYSHRIFTTCQQLTFSRIYTKLTF